MGHDYFFDLVSRLIVYESGLAPVHAWWESFV